MEKNCDTVKLALESGAPYAYMLGVIQEILRGSGALERSPRRKVREALELLERFHQEMEAADEQN